MDSLKPEDATDTLNKIKPLAWDQPFWHDLKFDIDVLEPIDKAIKMAESDRSTAGHVVTRWKRIRRAMKAKLSEGAGWHPDIATCEEATFEKRFKRQVTETYFVAHLLNPKMWMTMRYHSIPRQSGDRFFTSFSSARVWISLWQ
jgi:hypothetical protein